MTTQPHNTYATSISRQISEQLTASGLYGSDVRTPSDGTTFVVRGGTGHPIVLLHGYPQDWTVWATVMINLATDHEVIVPSLPGIGGSAPWPGGGTTPALANWLAAVLAACGVDIPIAVVGHDVGSWIATALAATNPEVINNLTLMDAFLPGITDSQALGMLPGSPFWHLHFQAHPEAPSMLIAPQLGHFLTWFLRTKSADPAVFDNERIAYFTRLYSEPGVLDNALAYYRALPESIAQVASAVSATGFDKPVLVVAGERAPGQRMIDEVLQQWPQARGVVLPGVGHYLPEESPADVIRLIRPTAE